MDLTLSLSSDWLNLMAYPLVLLTLKDLIPKWKQTWDDHLTFQDRRIILRTVIFLALPVVVFLHELGHYLAALQVGAKVYGFYFGPVTGHVNVAADIPPAQSLWIAVAGNLAQVVTGIVALLMAVFVRSPALVAFLVYLGLFAIGDTVIFYAALSLASYYGDWQNIYQSPCTNYVFDVGIVHGALIAFVLYCMNATAPRLWFTQKTNSTWYGRHQAIMQKAKAEPGLVSRIELINSYIEAGLFKEAQKCINSAPPEERENPAMYYARAEFELAKGDVDKAMSVFQKLAEDSRIDDQMRARIILQVGELWLYRRDSMKALASFEAAAALDHAQGDSHLQRALIKANTNDFQGLADDIAVIKSPETRWVYLRNQELAGKELERLDNLLTRWRQENRA